MSEEPSFLPRRSLRRRFNLAGSLAVSTGLAVSLAVALVGLQRLGQESSGEMEAGLEASSREYLLTYLVQTARDTGVVLGKAAADLRVLAGITQNFLDKRQELAPALLALSQTSGFVDRMVYSPEGNWYQNGPEEPAAVAIWGYLLEPPGGAAPPRIKPDVLELVRDTAVLDAVLPSFQRSGAANLQVYFVGPEPAPYLRVTPWANAAGEADKKYPGHNTKPFWDFYFPGLVDSWKLWARNPERLKRLGTPVTVTPPYDDAGGGGLVMTFFHPLWAPSSQFAGAVGVDLTLKQVVDAVLGVKLFRTGFAFLAQSNGNVLAVHGAGDKVMGLQHAAGAAGTDGVDVLARFLKDSREPAVASLRLPESDNSRYEEVSLGGQRYVLALQRLPPLNVWSGAVGINPEQWTLGFLVPRDEIYASLGRARAAIADQTRTLATTLILSAGGTLLLVLLAFSLVSRRMTAALADLASGAAKISRKDYDVQIDVRTRDEIGQLGVAFNQMAAEIRENTLNLEKLVRQRTAELETASKEIQSLNGRLKEENLRLNTELDVAQRIQLMVLPQPRELQEIKGLDIVGYMKPAAEVGGDYYDVISSGGNVKIGIGDITGNGLESGVLMLMVQTAVRTLRAAEEQDPARFLNIVNRVIYENVQRTNLDRNLTLSLLDYSDGQVRLVGQHEEVLVVRQDGSLERVDTTSLGFPVGLEFDISQFVNTVELKLDPGDVLVLYTDGITEAVDAQNRAFGLDGLCQVVQRHHHATAAAIKEAIIAEVARHVGSQRQFDDLTVVVLKRT